MQKCLLLMYCAFLSATLYSSPKEVDSLLAQVALVANDSAKADIFNEIAHLSYRNDPNITLQYATAALTLADEIGYDFGRLMGLKNKGIGQLFLNQPKEALTTFHEVVRQSEEKGFKQILHQALSKMAALYLDLGDLEAAVKTYQKAVLIAKMKGDEADYCSYTNQLAELLVGQGEIDRAYRMYSKIYQIASRLQYMRLKADIRSGMARVLLQQKKYEQCLHFFADVLNIYTGLKDKGGIIQTLNSIGEVHCQNEDNRSALQFYKRALKIAKTNGASTLIAACYQIIAQHTLDNHQYRKAISNAKLGLEHAGLANKTELRRAFFEILTKAYEELGKFKKGLLFHKKLKTLEDSLSVFNEAQKIAQLELAYESQSKEIENEMLREQQLLHQSELKKDKWIAFIIGIGLLLVSCLAFFLHRINQQKRKFNLALLKEVDNRTKQLEQTNFQLKKSNKELERFSHIASHDLKEPLRNITSFIRLIERRLKGENESLKEYLQFVQNNAKQMNLLIEDVLEFSQINRKEIVLESVNMNQIVKQIKVALRGIVKENHVVLEHPDLPKIYSNTGQIYLVLKNIVENGVRFNNNPIKHIKISYEVKDDCHLLGVKDNGIGVDKMYHEKIFEMFERLQNRKHYKGSGLGLSLCKKIIEGMQGEIWVEDDISGGSIFYIKIPIKKDSVKASKGNLRLNSARKSTNLTSPK